MDAVPAPPPEAPRRGQTWGIGDWWLGMCAWIAAQIAGAAVYAAEGNEVTISVFAVSQLVLWVGWLGVPVWAARRKGGGSLAHDFGFRFRWPDSWRGIGIGVLCQLVLVPLIYLPVQLFVDDLDLEGAAQDLAERMDGIAFAALAVLFVVGAPIVEELFFRGLLLRSLLRRTPRWVAIVVSSLAFAVLHLEPVQMPALFAVGVVFAVLALRYDRLGPAIWAHAGFNTIATIGLWLGR